MLRDRCPKVVSHALKWCKAKEKWLDYVYKEQIWVLSSKKDRLHQTKAILGLTGKNPKFVFDETIFWEGLNRSEYNYWKTVSGWVHFFVTKYAYIENTYKISKEKGKTIEELKIEIINKWFIDLCPTTEDSDEQKAEKTLYVNNLTDYLIDCFENNV